MELEISKIESWFPAKTTPIVISGPCSAETEEQLMETCAGLKKIGIEVMRAGVWKPRTRPNGFEGVGKMALEWIQNVKQELGVSFAVEVANPQHVELCLKAGIDILWIGARSTVNPFTVQEIADSLKGIDIPVFIKNPVNPDLALWMGAIERVYLAGIRKMAAIHRGFSSFQKTKYRNIPNWQIALELKRELPQMPLICDPSHICGNRELLASVAQKSLDLGYEGIMIESHRDPDKAWSDAKQQITPETLKTLLQNLKPKTENTTDNDFHKFIEEMRDQIDKTDREIIEMLAQRMKIVEKIGEYKKNNNITSYQSSRYDEILKTRSEWGKMMNLNPDFTKALYQIIHMAAVNRQEQILKPSSEIYNEI